MKLKFSKIMIILFMLTILAGVIYFVIKNPQESEEQVKPISYQTINMITNIKLGISNFDSMHPYVTKNREVIYINSLIFDTLLTITEDYKIKENLAKEWSKVGETSYIIKLKDNIKWSNKNNLTATDVKFSVEELQKNKESIYYENVKEIKKVEVVDNNTIRIELKQKVPFFEYYLIFPIISKEQYSNKNIKEVKQIPIGSGKYKITKLEEKKIELSKNEEWSNWENIQCNIKTVTINIYETMGEVYNSFKTGNIDFMHTANKNVEEYIGSMGYGKKIYGNREYDYLVLNCKANSLQYSEVRRAISMAINTEKIIAAILENKAVISYFPLEENSYLLKENIVYNEIINKKQSEKNAKKALEDSGWKYEYGVWQKQIDGKTKTINIKLSVNKEDEQRLKVAKEIKNQLEQIGIKVEIEEITKNKYEEYLKNKNYEMLLTGIYTPISPDISSFFKAGNLANYNNKEINNILEEVNNIRNEELLQEKYSKIMQIYFEDVPYIGLYRNQDIITYTSSFRGDITPNNYNIYYNFSSWYKQE